MATKVGPALERARWPAKNWCRSATLATLPARIEQRMKKVEDGAGGLVEQPIRFPVWFDPKAATAQRRCARR
jgi:hypothetical protein